MRFFAETTNPDNRFVVVLIVIMVILFSLIGLIGFAIRRVMKFQAKKADDLMALSLRAHVVTDPKSYDKLAWRKNITLFYKQSLIGFLFIILGMGLWVIYNWATGNWNDNIIENFKDLHFIHDWANEDNFTTVFGMKVLAQFPPLLSSPHIVEENIAGYLVVLLNFVGLLWLLVAAQAFVSRKLALRTNRRIYFSTSIKEIKEGKENKAILPHIVD